MKSFRPYGSVTARLAATVFVSACLVTGQPLQAQAPTVADCREIDDAAARFACYESIEVQVEAPARQSGEAAQPASAARANPATATRQNAAGDRPQVSSGKAAPEEDAPEAEKKSFLGRLWPFGGNDDGQEVDSDEDAVATAPDQVEAFGRSADARVVEKQDGEKELHDRIAALEQLGANQWLITLESGQTWRQMISKQYRLKVGDEVRIYPTRWGSDYRLTASRLQSYIQVARVD